MDSLRLSAVAARVVAWHNRHPLARRITAAQVHAIGYVALPFVGEGVASAPSAAVLAAEAIALAAVSSASAPVAGVPITTLDDVVELHAEPEGLEIDVDDGDGPAPVANSAGSGHRPEAPVRADAYMQPGAGASLRERALARARQPEAQDLGHGPTADTEPAHLLSLVPGTLKPNFSEDFIDPLRPRAVARFAARHGLRLTLAPSDGPVRLVQADGVAAGRVAVRVYLLTAVIETDTRKSRVLLGSGTVVLGRRIFSAPRLALLAALGSALVGTPLALWRAPAKTAAPLAAVAAMPAAAASALLPWAEQGAASATLAPDPAPSTPAALDAAAADTAASAATPAGSAEQASAPAAGGSIVPRLSGEEKAMAKQARQALRPQPATSAAVPSESPPPASPAAAPAPASAPAPVSAPAPAPVSAPAAAPAPAARAPLPPMLQTPAAAAPSAMVPAAAAGAQVFAVSTRLLRTRAEAEQVSVAMRSLLRTLGANDTKVDVLAQGDDWRVVALPFKQRIAAEQARVLLVSRGMRVEVVDF